MRAAVLRSSAGNAQIQTITRRRKKEGIRDFSAQL